MSIQDVAKELVALCAAGKFIECGDKLWADNVVSIESAEGPMARLEGKAAVRGKSEWWEGAHDIHETTVEGPYVNGAQFVVRFKTDMTVKETGARMTMDEIGLYTVADGKIVEERFFYG